MSKKTTEEKPPELPELITKESMGVMEKKSSGAVDKAGEISIKTDSDLATASDFLSNIKILQKFVRQEKDKRIKPVKELKSWIEGLFSPVEDDIDRAETIVKSKMSEYHDKVEKENEKKAESIAKRAESGQLKPETAVRKMEELGEVKTSVKTTSGSSTFSKVKRMRITDPSKVPDVYWIIDEVTLRSAALTEAKNQNKLGEVIPGCEVYEETIVGGRV